MHARWPIRVFFALVAVVYLTVFPYLAHVNNPNENVRTYTTMALVEHHTFCIDRLIERHGHQNDLAFVPDPSVPGGGRRYSVKAPFVSYAGVPFYWMFTKVAAIAGHPVPTLQTAPDERAAWLRITTFVLRFFVVQIPCLAFLVLFERWLRRYSQDTVIRLSAVAACGLGTNYLAYALMNVSHALFAVVAFGAFAITTTERLTFSRSRDRRVGRAFLVGFFCGAATLLEYHALGVSVVLAVYGAVVFFSPKRLLALALGGLVDVGALMLFQWRAFGNPLTPGHKMVENPVFAHNHSAGLFGIELPNPEVFRDISLSRAFGFFGTSPFMWLGLLGLALLVWPSGTARARRRMRITTAVWATTMLVLWLTVSAYNYWRGGWTIGPRFLGAAPPFFAFGAVCGLERFAGHSTFRRALVRGIAGGLATMAVLQTGLVSILYNTLPEGVTRAFPQVAIPLLRTGFAPYDWAEFIGWRTTLFFDFVAACLVAIPLFAAFLPGRQRWRTYLLRVPAFALAFFLAWSSAMSEPEETEGEGGDYRRDLQFLTTPWEPAGRDRIALVREQAQRYGPRGPCLWYKLADLERIVHWDGQAAADERRANGSSRASCH